MTKKHIAGHAGLTVSDYLNAFQVIRRVGRHVGPRKPELVIQACKRVLQGESLGTVARDLGVSRRHVSRWLRRLGLARPVTKEQLQARGRLGGRPKRNKMIETNAVKPETIELEKQEVSTDAS